MEGYFQRRRGIKLPGVRFDQAEWAYDVHRQANEVVRSRISMLEQSARTNLETGLQAAAERYMQQLDEELQQPSTVANWGSIRQWLGLDPPASPGIPAPCYTTSLLQGDAAAEYESQQDQLYYANTIGNPDFNMLEYGALEGPVYNALGEPVVIFEGDQDQPYYANTIGNPDLNMLAYGALGGPEHVSDSWNSVSPEMLGSAGPLTPPSTGSGGSGPYLSATSGSIGSWGDGSFSSHADDGFLAVVNQLYGEPSSGGSTSWSSD